MKCYCTWLTDFTQFSALKCYLTLKKHKKLFPNFGLSRSLDSLLLSKRKLDFFVARLKTFHKA